MRNSGFLLGTRSLFLLHGARQDSFCSQLGAAAREPWLILMQCHARFLCQWFNPVPIQPGKLQGVGAWLHSDVFILVFQRALSACSLATERTECHWCWAMPLHVGASWFV